MIFKKTILILGAGASVDYGFPLGRDLVLRICASLSDTAGLQHATLLACGFSASQIHEFQSQLADSNLSSIDAFLENREEFEDIGKAAIAAVLIPCERKDRLRRASNVCLWYEYLHSKLIGRNTDFFRNQLAVVTFNYDRSFEAALFNALSNAYGLTDGECRPYVEGIPVVHVYGQLGKPSWLGNGGRPYDDGMNSSIVKKTAQSLKVIHRGDTNSQELQDARAYLSWADTVCCLGFSYHPVNTSRLQLGSLLNGKKIFLSAYGMSEGERQTVHNRLFTNKVSPGTIIEWGGAKETVLDFLRRTDALSL